LERAVLRLALYVARSLERFRSSMDDPADDLAKVISTFEFELDTSELGRLRCGAYSFKVATNIQPILDKEDLSGAAFTRHLLQQVGRRVPADGKENDGLQGVLTDEQVALINENELQHFAQEFLAHNDFLLKLEDEEDGAEATSPKPPEAFDEKKSGESECDYLLRAVRRYNHGLTARMQKVLEPFQKAATALGSLFKNPPLSGSTINALRKNFAQSDRLQASLGRLREVGPLQWAQPKPLPSLELPENPAHETNRRLGRLLAVLERTEPVIIESGQLVRDLNNVAIRMLADFGRSTRRGEGFNKIIIGIAAFTFVVTAIFSTWSFFDARKRTEEAAALIATLRTDTGELTASEDRRLERLVQDFLRDSLARRDEQSKVMAALLETLHAEQDRLGQRMLEDRLELRRALQSLTDAVRKPEANPEPPAKNLTK
jgi:hypothetical protein